MGFLTKYDGELRELLVWRQGSQVSMRVVRESMSLLLSHCRGNGTQDTSKKDARCFSQVAEGDPGFP